MRASQSRRLMSPSSCGSGNRPVGGGSPIKARGSGTVAHGSPENFRLLIFDFRLGALRNRQSKIKNRKLARVLPQRALPRVAQLGLRAKGARKNDFVFSWPGFSIWENGLENRLSAVHVGPQ